MIRQESEEVKKKNVIYVHHQISWMMKLPDLCTKVMVLSRMWTPLQS